jgi:hypothetical protein
MTRKSSQSFVDKVVELLVKEFGLDSVRAATAKASNRPIDSSEGRHRGSTVKRNLQVGQTVAGLLEQFRGKDEKRHRLLAGFYERLKARTILPETDDMRHFALVIGLKEINGKSRKDMIPRLMRFLAEQPMQRLEIDIQAASDISEQQRSKGFSVLTDKLMGGGT